MITVDTSILQRVIANNIQRSCDPVQRMVILLHPKCFAVGDNCLLLSYTRYIKAFFGDCSIDINYDNPHFVEYEDLLLNNPFVHSVSCRAFADIDFNFYDLVMILSFEEHEFLKFIDQHYNTDSRSFTPSLYSYSYALGKYPTMFPIHRELVDYVTHHSSKTALHELHISPDESSWGTRWLEENGVRQGDKVIVVLDESGDSAKQLKTTVHFDIVEYFLKTPNVKLLVFDKKNIGKEEFYMQWLGNKAKGRLVFAKKMPLRSSLSILSSEYIQMVFGPCTGLLHCAAGICGSRLNKGVPTKDLPSLVVYTGKYPAIGYGDAFYWWGESLVDCWVIKKELHGKDIIVLKEIGNSPVLSSDDILECKEYETPMILDKLKHYRMFAENLR